METPSSTPAVEAPTTVETTAATASTTVTAVLGERQIWCQS